MESHVIHYPLNRLLRVPFGWVIVALLGLGELGESMLLLLDPRKLLNARESLNHRHTSVCSPWYPQIFGSLPWYVSGAFWVEV